MERPGQILCRYLDKRLWSFEIMYWLWNAQMGRSEKSLKVELTGLGDRCDMGRIGKRGI